MDVLAGLWEAENSKTLPSQIRREQIYCWTGYRVNYAFCVAQLACPFHYSFILGHTHTGCFEKISSPKMLHSALFVEIDVVYYHSTWRYPGKCIFLLAGTGEQRSLACINTFSFMIIVSIQYFIHYLCLKAWKRHPSPTTPLLSGSYPIFFISILFFDKFGVGYFKNVLYKCICCCITFIKTQLLHFLLVGRWNVILRFSFWTDNWEYIRNFVEYDEWSPLFWTSLKLVQFDSVFGLTQSKPKPNIPH